MSLAIPSDDEKDDLLLACRYGDLEDIEQFVNKFGPDAINDIRDHSGNTVLHMVCANGHAGVSFTTRCTPSSSRKLTHAR